MIKSKNLKFVVLFFLLALFVFSNFVMAQSIFTTNLGNYPGGVFSITNLIKFIGSSACYLIRFGIISVFVAFIVYGIMFLKSRGNPQEFGGAKKSLVWGIVGGLVIFGVFTIILSVVNILGVDYDILAIIKC